MADNKSSNLLKGFTSLESFGERRFGIFAATVIDSFLNYINWFQVVLSG